MATKEDGPNYVYFHLMVGSTVPTNSDQPMPLDTEDSGFANLLKELEAEYLTN